MPSITVFPQENGYWRQWLSVIGGTHAWDAIDDPTSDGDTSYLRIVTSDALPTPRASFHFHGTSNLRPSTVTLRATHRETVADCLIGCGFLRHVPGSTDPDDVEEALPFTVGSIGTYAEATFPFTAHPFTGEAWRPGDLNGMEALVFVQKTALSVHPVQLRLTRLAVQIDYDEPTYYTVGG